MNPYLEYFKEKTILITGCNGFVGRNLIDKLSQITCKLVGLDIHEKSKNENLYYYSCDLSDFEELKKIIDKEEPELIFNLASIVTAARDYSLFLNMIEINVKVLYYLYSILKTKSNFELLINMGSTEEYGDYRGIPFEEDFFEKSLSPYAVTKTAGVHFAYMVGKNEGFPIISIRPSVLFGKYQSKDKFIPYVMQQLITDQPLDLTPGEQTRDFISINQFLNILFCLVASKRYQTGEIYNIASGVSISLKEIVMYLKTKISSNSPLNFGTLPYRDNEIMDFRVSINKIRSIIDYQIAKKDIFFELEKLLFAMKKEAKII